ncbi:MAG: nucleotidyl transferase AbiEii/AbiGii toxin family protein [Bacteroidetes bacterium]|nr:nucleotidyl transferase AbiEii/AbiGii toxin family protein [Bacteroidota bacterium]
MLHTETDEPGTFSLLKNILSIPELKDFSLVEGTALSLLYGHRKSIDLDLFSEYKFENDIIIDSLKEKFSHSFFNRVSKPKIGIFLFYRRC